MNTRPTSDRVKESIFNILQGNFEGKKVLDLFAGVGNLGIEALSRGALETVFVENDRKVLSVLEKNLRNCGFIDQSRTIGTTAAKGIKILERSISRFDFVFLDPPYGHGVLKDTLEILSQSNILKCNTLIIVEHSSRDTMEGDMERLVLKDQRRYGITVISFLEKRRIGGEEQ